MTHVRVWSVVANDCSPSLPAMFSTLSDEERVRIGRMRTSADRARAIVGRGGLRYLAGRYLGVDPADVRLVRDSHGKPSFGCEHATRLHFNVSHSGDLALIALAWGRSVGVDVEQVRPDVDVVHTALPLFSSADRGAIGRLPSERRVMAVYDSWTRREAYLKALGVGLSFRLDTFDVLRHEAGSSILSSVRFVDFVTNCAVRGVDAGGGYSAAVAVCGPTMKRPTIEPLTMP